MEKLMRVKVHPQARENRLEENAPGRFEVWVKAEPQQGQANAAVLALLAQHLGIPAKKLRIIKGATSPSKIVAILGA
jgi:hypothetical protein